MIIATKSHVLLALTQHIRVAVLAAGLVFASLILTMLWSPGTSAARHSALEIARIHQNHKYSNYAVSYHNSFPRLTTTVTPSATGTLPASPRQPSLQHTSQPVSLPGKLFPDRAQTPSRQSLLTAAAMPGPLEVALPCTGMVSAWHLSTISASLLSGVAAVAPDYVWAVGSRSIVRWNGANWQKL